MTFLPIVGRELRVEARRKGTYWLRFFVGIQAMFVAVVVWILEALNPRTVKFGTALFWGLSGVALVHCLLAGRRSTADCLSQEKREGTMGLLFLTDLTGFDVVIGKLVATSLGGFYGLLAIFPVLAVPLLVGGMTSGELWRMSLVLIVTFIFTLSIGVFCSAGSREYKEAIGRNFLVLTTFTIIVPMIGLAAYMPRLSFVPGFFLACPFYAFGMCEDANYMAHPNDFWSALIVMHGLSWLLVMRACRLLPISWQDIPSAARARFAWWKAFKQAINYGGLAGRKGFRKWALDQNGYFWLAARERFKPLHVWAFLLTACLWWLIGWGLNGKYWLSEMSDATMALLLTTTLKLWVTVEAGQRLAADREAGAMELLLCTSLTAPDFLRAVYLTLRRQFLRPLVIVLISLAALMILSLTHNPEYGWLPWVAVIIVLPLDILAVALVGVWTALFCKTHTRATLATVMRILVAPWIAFGVVMAVVTALRELNYLRNDDTPLSVQIGLWCGFSLIADAWFGWRAWQHLQTDFRDLAMQRYGLRAKRIAAAKHVRTTTMRWRPAVVAGTALAVIACIAWARYRPSFPPPVMVTLTSSNAPIRAYPTGRWGMFLILPDGSLWRWGEAAEGPLFSRTAMPVQVGTNRDWVKVQVRPSMRVVGLRENGTIWEWGILPGGNVTQEPTQRNQDTDWKDIAVANNQRVALRRDGTLWSWNRGTNGFEGGRGRFLHQVGTSTNWDRLIAVDWQTIAGVQSDGTVWFMPARTGQSLQDPVLTNGLPGNVASDNWMGRDAPVWPKLTLTEDGTLWTQGIDFGEAPSPTLWQRIQAVQGRLANRQIITGPQPPTSERPRPLMKLKYAGN